MTTTALPRHMSTMTTTDRWMHAIATALVSSDPMARWEAFTNVHREAVAWLKDCEWGDVTSDDIDSMDIGRVLRAVERHYDGGMAAFLASGVL